MVGLVGDYEADGNSQRGRYSRSPGGLNDGSGRGTAYHGQTRGAHVTVSEMPECLTKNTTTNWNRK
jgi:hypothetical protein